MDIAKRITELRTSKKLSVNKLANLAGLSQGFIREVELGKKNLTVKSLTYICDALDISLKDFFTTESNQIVDSRFIESYNKLSDKQKEALINFLRTL